MKRRNEIGQESIGHTEDVRGWNLEVAPEDGPDVESSGVQENDLPEGRDVEDYLPHRETETKAGPAGGKSLSAIEQFQKDPTGPRKCARCGFNYHIHSFLVSRRGQVFGHDDCFSCRYLDLLEERRLAEVAKKEAKKLARKKAKG